jgi:rubrerythrin
MQKTLKNLATAFVGESQARNRYTMYAKVAKKEGYEEISALFTLTAEQEKEHAKWLFKLIQDLKQDAGVTIEIDASIPTTLGNTKENLKAAIAGENYEHTSMYPEFADIADEEGLPEIATRLRAIANAETNHENRYQKVLADLENDAVFEKEEEVEWVCRECGYTHKGKTPPEVCPSCNHPKAYYEVIKN